MRIFIKAKPNAYEEKIEKVDETHFIVSVTEPPIKGAANAAIILALAEYFNISQSSVKMVSGYSSSQKVFEITQE